MISERLRNGRIKRRARVHLRALSSKRAASPRHCRQRSTPVLGDYDVLLTASAAGEAPVGLEAPATWRSRSSGRRCTCRRSRCRCSPGRTGCRSGRSSSRGATRIGGFSRPRAGRPASSRKKASPQRPRRKREASPPRIRLNTPLRGTRRAQRINGWSCFRCAGGGGPRGGIFGGQQHGRWSISTCLEPKRQEPQRTRRTQRKNKKSI